MKEEETIIIVTASHDIFQFFYTNNFPKYWKLLTAIKIQICFACFVKFYPSGNNVTLALLLMLLTNFTPVCSQTPVKMTPEAYPVSV